MAINVINGTDDPTTGLPYVPDGLAYKLVVTDSVTGKYYKANGLSNAPVVKDGDFTINLSQYNVLEYILFKNADEMSIKIGYTEGGNELLMDTIGQPLVFTGLEIADLMHPAPETQTIFVSGILPGTIVKIKIS